MAAELLEATVPGAQTSSVPGQTGRPGALENAGDLRRRTVALRARVTVLTGPSFPSEQPGGAPRRSRTEALTTVQS